jgi:hypothetical protein
MNATTFLNPLTDWLNEHVADLRYEPTKKPETIEGKLTRGVTEFLTGFIPVLKGLRGLGMAGNVAAPMLAGAISDFTVRDPHEARLADLWKQLELPDNVLTDYLQSKPDDTEMESRFKNALEGAGLGVMTEGVFMAARALRAMKAVRETHVSEVDQLRAKYGEITDEHIKVLGDPKRSVVQVGDEIKPGPDLDPRALIRGRKGEPFPENWSVYVNWSKIDEPDQVKFIIGKMAEAAKSQIDEARRGVMTQKAMVDLADDLGMDLPTLLARRKGEAFNAETALAARKLWAASAEKLLELSKKAADPNAGPVDVFMFRKMMAVHAAIQAEVIGARTETARALGSWKIPVGGIERARAVDQMLATHGGAIESKEMARRLAILADNKVPASVIGQIAFKGYGSATADSFKEAWINGLLSSPTTHAVNIVSNTIVPFMQMGERAVAGGLRAVVGGEGVAPHEAAAMAYGMVMSVRDAWRTAAKSLRTGESQYAFNKIDMRNPRAITPETWNLSRETGLGRFVHYLGEATRIPSRLMGAEDDFFKTIGYRMELHAQAARQASQEGLTGREFGMRMAEIIKNPPEHIHMAATDAALYNTFTSEVGNFGRGLIRLRDGTLNPMTFILPFVRTPVNIARYAFERSPIAPLVGQWRADIAAGGARADLALARMATGTAIMMTTMDFADQGVISGRGPSDPEIRAALQRQGWKPYSWKSNGTWRQYSRTDPMGMTMGFAADIVDAIKTGEINEDDVDEWQEVLAMAISVVGQVTINKTYLEGFANFVEVISDPKRYSEQYVDRLFASFLPLTSASYAVKNVIDPVQREYGTPAEAVQARIAFLSERLPPVRNLWGEPLTIQQNPERGKVGTAYDALTPWRGKDQVDSPIDKEIVRLAKGIQRIEKKSVFAGVDSNMKFWPEVYDEYVRLAGNELKSVAHGGMGAKDYLNAVVSGKHPVSEVYRILPDVERQRFIQSTVNDFRKLAQQEILMNPRFRPFADEIQRLQENYRAGRMPVLQ